MGALVVGGVFAFLLLAGLAYIEAYEAGLAHGRARAEAEVRAAAWAALRSLTSQPDISQQHASGAWRVVRALSSSRIEE